ncbi:MAG: hypothetical protein AMJ75_09400 [Phycisphaerae bacterium SM1_79]|nr:MAG: hypothetical protein AMJ75_09400 [Phycisphaerae bacterium SM1_79]
MNFLPLLLILGLTKRYLSFFELVAHFILPSCQLAKPVKNLKILTLRRLLLRLGQTLCLVSVLSLSELQLLQLLLGAGRAGTTVSVCITGACNLMLTFSQFE